MPPVVAIHERNKPLVRSTLALPICGWFFQNGSSIFPIRSQRGGNSLFSIIGRVFECKSGAEVRRASYNRLRPLEKLKVEKRGWTLDVLQVVQSLGKPEFTLADVYAHADELAKLHPDNRHVRDKIRQQLQVLRDLGLLEFLGGGSYRLA